jgi:hypothetical protein
VVQRAERSPQYHLGPMWTMYSSFHATLGLEQPAAALAPLCTPAGRCLFVVLQARVRGHRQLPCVHSCMNRAGSQC